MRWVRHPRTKGALTHTTVVGITVTAVGAFAQILPDVPDWLLFIGGMVMMMGGFVGLHLTINGDDPRADS